jgi:ribosomal protein S18 acetylase RimI-like enzyme
MENIFYTSLLNDVSAENLSGFFVGWETVPSKEAHLNLLKGSDYVVLAIDGEKVVGFITAITDKTLAAYIPLLEVLPEYQKQGIGAELVKRILELLKDFYMIDLLCDIALQAFYEQFGMERVHGMYIRNYSKIPKD